MIASRPIGATETLRGPRPIDPSRDLAQVADLVGTAFAGDIDEDGMRVLKEMRSMSRAGPLLWLLDRTSPEFREAFGGYVWIEEGRVVGNVSLNRLSPLGNRWQISNVAVEPFPGEVIFHPSGKAAFLTHYMNNAISVIE